MNWNAALVRSRESSVTRYHYNYSYFSSVCSNSGRHVPTDLLRRGPGNEARFCVSPLITLKNNSGGRRPRRLRRSDAEHLDLYRFRVPVRSLLLAKLNAAQCLKYIVNISAVARYIQTSPNSMGLRCLITEFLWPPSSSIIRLWLPYSTKVLGKKNQTSPNSMGLRRLITEFLWPPSSSINRPWLPYSIKVLVKKN
ncbi:hypothetical protein EVAR_22986_1 [Eumeta japonica]|uniref:Uncharacterized protein n=1 Tax=Eumeta variegata TaxID=151549 RepID=A0A4C1URB8_EUMVA|nr:hypothetical protein EVAR_22986_1 [Eumeta japonica]